jgi:hypothetical protein
MAWKPISGGVFSSAPPAPGGRVADVAFEKHLEPAEPHLLPGRHGGDAHGQAAAQAREHDLARGRRRVLAEQVQRLVHHHRCVLADVAERAVLAFHHGVDLVGAAAGRVGPALGGKGGQAFGVDRAQPGLEGLGVASAVASVMVRVLAG